MSYYLTGDSGTVAFQPFSGVVESEDATYSNKVTSNPIEGGGAIDDHAVADPVKVSVSGVVTSVVGGERAVLIAMCQNRDLLNYRGEDVYNDMLITSLSIGRSKAAGIGGFTFKLTLQQMRLTGAAYAPVMAFAMSGSDRAATHSKATEKSAKAEENIGLVTALSGYADYVSSFNDPQPKNTGITSARTNPTYRGY